MTRAVAFFRNLNLGHRGSPTRVQLVAAFETAGATDVTSFQTNGTVVFEAAEPAATAAEARRELAEVGYAEPVVVLTLDRVVEVVRTLPDLADTGYPELSLTFFGPLPPGSPLPPVPTTDPLGRVEMLRLDRDHALSGACREGSRVGNPNGHVERHVGLPATTRTVGTVRRLVARFHEDPE